VEDKDSGRKKKGSLFIVATPIGNLEDFTFRALRVLREVEAIACEDTRQTIKLLSKYDIHKRLISYYQPKEGQRIPQILGLLDQGKDVALVSDSGTPGVSDPGYILIREAVKAGFRIQPIPGPSALVAALSGAALPTHRVLFLGFPPPKREKARKFLQSLREEEATLVFYLPTRKIIEFLSLAEEVIGNREAVIARELTKVHEEYLRGTIRELREKAETRQLKGEATVLIGGRPKNKPQTSGY
jgi:16S rRNA (cytidine1402-2'-O)-methyltransferase